MVCLWVQIYSICENICGSQALVFLERRELSPPLHCHRGASAPITLLPNLLSVKGPNFLELWPRLSIMILNLTHYVSFSVVLRQISKKENFEAQNIILQIHLVILYQRAKTVHSIHPKWSNLDCFNLLTNPQSQPVFHKYTKDMAFMDASPCPATKMGIH